MRITNAYTKCKHLDAHCRPPSRAPLPHKLRAKRFRIKNRAHDIFPRHFNLKIKRIYRDAFVNIKVGKITHKQSLYIPSDEVEIK